MSGQVSVPVSAIRRDPRAWPRTGLSRERVAMFTALYREAGEGALPPLEVVPVGEGSFLLSDGWHRLQAAVDLGWTAVPALVVEVTDGSD